MKSLAGAWIFCVAVLSWAELAVGTYPVPPQDYDYMKDQCEEPLPDDLGDYATKTVVTPDCGCFSLVVTNPNTGVESTYKISVEDSGCLTIDYNEAFFLVIYNSETKVVVVKNCIRYVVEGVIVIIALNDEGHLSSCSGNQEGTAEYAVVTRNEIVYQPTTVELTSADYSTILETCSTPLPPYFETSAEKRIIQDNSGGFVLECSPSGTVEVFKFVLVLVTDVGLYSCEDNSITYVVIVARGTVLITLKPAYLTTFESRSVLYALNDNKELCTTSFTSEGSESLIYTVAGHKSEEPSCGCGP